MCIVVVGIHVCKDRLFPVRIRLNFVCCGLFQVGNVTMCGRLGVVAHIYRQCYQDKTSPTLAYNTVLDDYFFSVAMLQGYALICRLVDMLIYCPGSEVIIESVYPPACD